MSQQQTEARTQKPESWPEFQKRMAAEGWQPKKFPHGDAVSFTRHLHSWYRPQEGLIELNPEHHPEHKNVQFWRYKEATQ